MPIRASVGDGGMNDRDDVLVVQRLLNKWNSTTPQPELAEDGQFGVELVDAITVFQQMITKLVDGRIDVDGPTIRTLERVPGYPAVIPIAVAILRILTDLDEDLHRCGEPLWGPIARVCPAIRAEAQAIVSPTRATLATFAHAQPVTGVLDQWRRTRTITGSVAFWPDGLTPFQVALILPAGALFTLTSLASGNETVHVRIARIRKLLDMTVFTQAAAGIFQLTAFVDAARASNRLSQGFSLFVDQVRHDEYRKQFQELVVQFLANDPVGFGADKLIRARDLIRELAGFRKLLNAHFEEARLRLSGTALSGIEWSSIAARLEVTEPTPDEIPIIVDETEAEPK